MKENSVSKVSLKVEYLNTSSRITQKKKIRIKILELFSYKCANELKIISIGYFFQSYLTNAMIN